MALRVEVDGLVTREVPLWKGEVEESDGDRSIRLDVELERGRVVQLRVVHPDQSPGRGATVELRRAAGRPWTWQAPRPDAVGVVDERGWVSFADMPASGLFIVTVHLEEHRDWFDETLDLRRQMHRLTVSRPCTLRIEMGPGCLPDDLPEGAGCSVCCLVESRQRVLRRRVVPNEPLVFEGLQMGDIVVCDVRTVDGSIRTLGPRVRVEKTSQDAVLDRSTSPTIRWEQSLGSEDTTLVRCRLVDPSGVARKMGDLGAFVPDRLVATWAKDGAQGDVGVRLDDWGPWAAASGSFEVPVAPPLTVTIHGHGVEPLTAEVGDTRTVVDLPFDVDGVLGTLATVRFSGAGGADPGAGWTVELRRVEDWSRFLAACDPALEDHTIETQLPAGHYVFTAYSGSLELGVGSVEVNGEGPKEVEVAFPGMGAAVGRLVTDRPIVRLTLVREDGAGLAARSSGPGASLAADGRFSARDLIAGDHALIAKVLVPDGAVVTTVATGLRIAPGEITDLGTIEWSSPGPQGVRLRRSAESLGVTATVEQGGVVLHGGWLSPGDTVLLPGNGPVRVRILRDALSRWDGTVLHLSVEAAGPVIDF